MKFILGISAFYHDSAAALLVDGQVVAAAHEERFSRIKHDPGFPSAAIRFVLEEACIELQDVSSIVFYDKPLLKFERLLETYHAFAPRGLRSFLNAIPVWINEKVFFRRMIKKELDKIGNISCEIFFCEHHLSHAASAFFPSPFAEAAILTIDGVGEWATSTIGLGHGKDISVLRQLNFPHSPGLLYSAFTYFLGFRVNSGEYKLMGLAPYGHADSQAYISYKKAIEETLVDIRPDGSILLNMDYFHFATGLTMIYDKKWEQLFGFSRREPEARLEARHATLARAIQHITEEIVLKMAQTAKQLTHSDCLVMAGGVALNCVANNALRKASIFNNIWVQPAAGDAGGALGAALATWFIHHQQNREASTSVFKADLGPGYHQRQIKATLDRYHASYSFFADTNELLPLVAQLIDQGNVIGWFQGRMEFGPRALGFRSILADPRNSEMQKRLNLKIKFREGFRPFAPVMLEAEATEFFEHGGASPYMLFVDTLKPEFRVAYPDESHTWGLDHTLYFERSQFPAITHIDYTARIQTVNHAQNPLLHELLLHFKKLSGTGMLINTSFNVRGEPIVCTPSDAYKCFLRTDMNYLVIGNFLLQRTDQDQKLMNEWKKIKMHDD
ncbi:MAG: hypothetical protein HC819_01650 [Cyclobacteriaceae bacterium]|nr:hypothetical protein [Cyclobacteriaceae bacterium]